MKSRVGAMVSSVISASAPIEHGKRLRRNVVGWHKDGDFFRHFLDSPEQGLLVIVVWSDIEPRGGGTFIACDSVPVLARFLAERPEGVLPGGFDFQERIKECRDFEEITGRAGDVVLLHPFVLHTVSQNHNGTARMITNPPVHLKAPMNFQRADKDYSPVERSILRALEVESLDFAPQNPRERIVPERVRLQAKMKEEEQARSGGSCVGDTSCRVTNQQPTGTHHLHPITS